jgi:hypothetical protein
MAELEPVARVAASEARKVRRVRGSMSEEQPVGSSESVLQRSDIVKVLQRVLRG